MNLAKKLFTFGGVCLMALSLASCGVSQSDADKINEAANNKEYYTVEKLLKKFGNPTLDLTVTIAGSTNGIMTWVNGCKTEAELNKKLDEGKDLSALVVTVVNNNATAASFVDSYKSSSK